MIATITKERVLGEDIHVTHLSEQEFCKRFGLDSYDFFGEFEREIFYADGLPESIIKALHDEERDKDELDYYCVDGMYFGIWK